MNRDITVNRIPSLTWNWLKMNQTTAKDVTVAEELIPQIEASEKISVSEGVETIHEAKTGLGRELNALLEEAGIGVAHITVSADTKEAEPVRMEYAYGEGAACANRYEIHAEENSEVTLVQYIHADADAKGSAILQTKYDIAENATVKLIQVQTVGENFTVLNDLGGVCADSGRFELIQIILGGRNYYGNYTHLAGRKSSYDSKIAYWCRGDEKLDMNYVSFHTGKKTECAINVSGVLNDRAEKVFRGTIDFQRGAKAAVGNEMEEVLLMDDDVINQTIPVILCQEEDVEGNHGATIGKLDESLLFYLQSRGLDLESIYDMMSKAKIEAVNSKIEDEKTRQIVLDYLKIAEAE